MKFDPKHKHKLDSPERLKILPPDKILRETGLKEGDVFVDIGCGTGYFSLPASRIVGGIGKVIAIDISVEILKELIKKIEKEVVKNIEVKESLPYEFPLSNNISSFSFMSNVLHEVEDKPKFLKEAYRILKDGGILVIIEWQKKETRNGPPVEERISETKVQHFIKVAGFKLIKSYPQMDTFNVYIGKK